MFRKMTLSGATHADKSGTTRNLSTSSDPDKPGQALTALKKTN
jgi:hypothetical protein